MDSEISELKQPGIQAEENVQLPLGELNILTSLGVDRGSVNKLFTAINHNIEDPSRR